MISDVKCFPVNGQGKIRARGSFLISNAFTVNYSLVEGSSGLFVSLPSHKGTDKEGKDKWYNDVFCTNEEVRTQMNKACIEAFQGSPKSTGSSKPVAATSEKRDGVPF